MCVCNQSQVCGLMGIGVQMILSQYSGEGSLWWCRGGGMGASLITLTLGKNSCEFKLFKKKKTPPLYYNQRSCLHSEIHFLLASHVPLHFVFYDKIVSKCGHWAKVWRFSDNSSECFRLATAIISSTESYMWLIIMLNTVNRIKRNMMKYKHLNLMSQ